MGGQLEELEEGRATLTGCCTAATSSFFSLPRPPLPSHHPQPTSPTARIMIFTRRHLRFRIIHTSVLVWLLDSRIPSVLSCTLPSLLLSWEPVRLDFLSFSFPAVSQSKLRGLNVAIKTQLIAEGRPRASLRQLHGALEGGGGCGGGFNALIFIEHIKAAAD